MSGSLKELRASPATQARYRTAVQYFLRVCLGIYGSFARSDTELDEHCSEFIKLAWQEGEARGQAADVIPGLQFALGRNKLLPASWGWLGVWGKHETPKRAPPLTQSQVMALACLGWHFGFFVFGILILVAFIGLLHTAEFFDLRACHVAFSRQKSRVRPSTL